MNDAVTIFSFLLVLVIAVIVFVLTREFWCWYWKINQLSSQLDETNRLLTQIAGGTVPVTVLDAGLSGPSSTGGARAPGRIENLYAAARNSYTKWMQLDAGDGEMLFEDERKAQALRGEFLEDLQDVVDACSTEDPSIARAIAARAAADFSAHIDDAEVSSAIDAMR